MTPWASNLFGYGNVLKSGIPNIGHGRPDDNATPVPTPIVERKTVSTSGTPEAVRGSATSLGSGAEVRGLPTNTGNAYVWISGGSKSQSRILTPGDEVFIPTDDLSNIKVDVDTGGEGVSIVAA